MYSVSFQERYFLFKTEVSVVKPVKFTRDRGSLACDEFLAIFKGDLHDIHVHTCYCVIVEHPIALHYIVCVGYFQA